MQRTDDKPHIPGRISQESVWAVYSAGGDSGGRPRRVSGCLFAVLIIGLGIAPTTGPRRL